MLKSVTVRTTVAAILAALSMSAHAIADSPRKVDVPAGELATAIQKLAEQSGVEFVFSPEQLKGLRTNGVHGEYTAEKAVTKLLEGTKLKLTIHESGALLISDAATGSANPKSDERVASTNTPLPLAGEGQGGGSKSEGFWSRFRLAQAESGSSPPPGKREGRGEARKAEGATIEEYEPQAGRGIPEVLVTGQRSLNADIERSPDDIQPYVVLDRKTIERASAQNLSEFLRTNLAMNYVAQSSAQAAPQTGGGSTGSIALRGLSPNQTLILIDGRRAGFRGLAGGVGQADLNGIPLNAIERVEVLPATASGIYGGAATGGVVNIVLRHDYTGLETSVKYEGAFDGGGSERSIGVSAGYSLGDNTSLLFTGSFVDTSQLRAGQRDFYSEYVRRRDENAKRNDLQNYLNSGSPRLGSTTNISSASAFDLARFLATGEVAFSAPNLVLKDGRSLGSPITSVPGGYTGAVGDALLQSAGNYNLDLADTSQAGARSGSLLNGPSIGSIYTTLRHAFSPRLETYFKAGASRNRGVFTQTSVPSTFAVPSSSPNNPFQQDIVVNIPIRIGDADRSFSENESVRLLAGLKWEISRSWSGSVEYAFDRVDMKQSYPSTSLLPAATQAITDGAIDILRDPPPGGFNLSSYAIPGDTAAPSHTTQKVISLRAAGPMIQLPGGKAILTMLVENTKQLYSPFDQRSVSFTGVASTSRYSAQSAEIDSAYLEAAIPILSEAQNIPGLSAVDMQIAGRYDSYKNIGGMRISAGAEPSERPTSSFHSVEPTVGLRVRPIKSIALRASYGTGFFPPGLNTLNPGATFFFPPFSTGLTDPKRGNESLGGISLPTGGSPNLKPEKSKSRSVGIVLTPPVEALRFSFDWTRIEKRDNLAGASFSQLTIDQEDLLNGVVIRSTDPSTFGQFGVGPITGLDISTKNAARAYSESYDISLNYNYDSGSMGAFEFYTTATRLVHSQSQFSLDQPTSEFAGLYVVPSWQGNAMLTWSYRALSVTWASRYFDSAWVTTDHSFDPVQGSARLPSAFYHDLGVTYDLERAGQRLLGQFSGSVQLGVKNIFNKEPRFFGASQNTYDGLTNPLQSTYYLSLNARF